MKSNLNTNGSLRTITSASSYSINLIPEINCSTDGSLPDMLRNMNAYYCTDIDRGCVASSRTREATHPARSTYLIRYVIENIAPPVKFFSIGNAPSNAAGTS